MKKMKLLLSLLAAIALTGCEVSLTSGSVNSGSATSDVGGSVSSNTSTGGSTSTGGGSTSTSGTSISVPDVLTPEGGGDPDVVRIREVNEQLGWSTLESRGTQKILVVPVRVGSATAWSSTMLNNLETAFFGNSEDTTWESVSSFYYKSSYGQLVLTGEVTSVFNYDSMSVSQLNQEGDEASDTVISAWEASNSISTSKRKEYDQDNDGLIDCAVFIYSNPYNSDGEGAYWAWCYYMNTAANTSKPVVNNYMWASYSFLEDGYSDRYNSDKVDAHTYIHESGHLLGLDDYYNYDQEWDPAGQLEMQSYNVGDQNIYSKYAMGWVTPTHAKTTTSATYTLETSASKPQALIINDSWNGTPFDEYLMLEFYTPTGLNETDANHTYSGRNRMYGYNGVRLYHIDARLAKLGPRGFVEYADSIGNDGYTYYVGASNTSRYSYLSSNKNTFKYVHLLDQGGNNKLNGGNGGSLITSSALWTAGNTFTPSSTFFYNNTNFNDGSKIGYSIRIDSVSSASAQVTITKI